MDLKKGFGPSIEPFTRVMYAMTGVTFFIHIAGCFLMTLNRYTAACHSLKHKSVHFLSK
ncbi:hypothetical protein OESDEN_20019 [Oesophagostomum dentatum]|uniref:Uncharacterized protein n=1 Tax=Oesophagostomum dentatum TaxID=61180 RepID=A0A0B1S9T9_OESDE|nr:hypothetical protein OESDEN_20019 [Oesophagostomum dentatum]